MLVWYYGINYLIVFHRTALTRLDDNADKPALSTVVPIYVRVCVSAPRSTVAYPVRPSVIAGITVTTVTEWRI